MAYKKKVVKNKAGNSSPIQSALNSGAFGLVGMLPQLFGMGGTGKPSKKVTIKKKK